MAQGFSSFVSLGDKAHYMCDPWKFYTIPYVLSIYCNFHIITWKLCKSDNKFHGKKYFRTLTQYYAQEIVWLLLSRPIPLPQIQIGTDIQVLISAFLLTTMLAAATSLFSRTNISQSYVVGSSAGTPSAPSSPASSAPPTPSFNVGPWKVQSATHRTTGKRVSIWSFDKRSPELERSAVAARERVLEVLKAEVSIQDICLNNWPSSQLLLRTILIDLDKCS